MAILNHITVYAFEIALRIGDFENAHQLVAMQVMMPNIRLHFPEYYHSGQVALFCMPFLFGFISILQRSPIFDNQKLKYISTLLERVYQSAQRIKLTSDDDLHATLVALLTSIESTVSRIESLYVYIGIHSYFFKLPCLQFIFTQYLDLQ